jgi:hypothetical protein
LMNPPRHRETAMGGHYNPELAELGTQLGQQGS